MTPLWPAELAAVAPSARTWIWHGYVAPRTVTLFTAQWKSGKTTLLSLLLARRVAGGNLAGRDVLPGKSIVLSEEDASHWHDRARRLDFGQHTCFLCRPFSTKPTMQQWLELIDQLADLHGQHGIDLVVIDSLSAFLPRRRENNADLVLEALMPLDRLLRLGLGLLFFHHPRKAPGGEGQAARGSGALASFVDIVLEMNYVGQPSAADRRRRLAGYSRFAETSRQLLIELDPAGADYACLAHDFAAADFLTHWDQLRTVLEDAEDKLTRQQIAADWPADLPRPKETTLWYWLDQALDKGLLTREGTGRKNDPYRYWLPHKQKEWQQNPLHDLLHPKRPVF